MYFHLLFNEWAFLQVNADTTTQPVHEAYVEIDTFYKV